MAVEEATPLVARIPTGRPASRAAAVLLAVGGLLFLGAYFDAGINYSDEGLAVDSARRILRGQMVCRDFADLVSGLSYVYALLFRLFGADVVLLRAVLVAVKVAAAVALFLAGCRVMPPGWALVPAVAALALSGPFIKAPLVAVYVVVVYQAIRLTEDPGRRQAAIAGLWLGWMAFLRLDVVLSVLAILVPWVVLARRHGTLRNWVVLAGSALAILALSGSLVVAVAAPFGWARWPTLADVATHAGWEEVLRGRMLQMPERPVWHLPMLAAHDLLAIVGGGFLGLRDWFMAIAGLGPPAATVQEHLQLLAVDGAAVTLLACGGILRRRPDLHGVLVACVAGAAVLKYVARADLPHFYQALPMLALLGTMAAHRIWTGLWGPGLPFGLRALAPAAGAALLGALLVASFWQSDVYLGTIGILRDAEFRLVYPGVRLRVRQAEADDLAQLVDFLAHHRRPGENLHAVPYCPLLYLVFGVDSPSCYSALYLTSPLYKQLQFQQEGMAAEVWRQQRVRFLVEDLEPQPLTQPFEDLFPRLREVLRTQSREVFRNRRFRVVELAS